MELVLKDGACHICCLTVIGRGSDIILRLKSGDTGVDYVLKSPESYAIVNFLTMLEDIRNKGESNG